MSEKFSDCTLSRAEVEPLQTQTKLTLAESAARLDLKFRSDSMHRAACRHDQDRSDGQRAAPSRILIDR